ncbi:MAG: hypothetical protein V3S43_06470 [Acidimicrobiia bacterium]
MERTFDSISDGMEMPRYKCHKEVRALKIDKIIIEGGGGALITPLDEGFAPFRVGKDYVERHRPIAGGYYVVYKDGYKSFSPAEPFEEGYVRCPS